MQVKYRNIKKEEFDKLKDLFPDDEDMWNKYRPIRLAQFDNQEIDVFVIEYNDEFIGEITVNYISHDLESETIPNIRVYLEAFRLLPEYQGKHLGQNLVNYVITYLTNKGYKEFTIGVEEDNEVAKHIYFKLGFIEPIDHNHGNEFDPCDYTLYLKR